MPKHVCRPSIEPMISASCDQSESLTLAVVRAVAELKGVDPADLDEPLTAVVDPDALEGLCEHAERNDDASDGTVVFEWNGCLVEVDFSGTVRARRLSSSHFIPRRYAN